MRLYIWTHLPFASVPSVTLGDECLVFVQVTLEHLNIGPWLDCPSSVETVYNKAVVDLGGNVRLR